MITGSCHCGAVTWKFDGMPTDATACNCTVCRRYGSLWAYDWVDGLITTSGETAIYMRGDHDIEFHFCPTCSCTTWWRGHRPHPDNRTRIAVNLRLADDPDQVAPIPMRHFDGLTHWQDTTKIGETVADMWF